MKMSIFEFEKEKIFELIVVIDNSKDSYSTYLNVSSFLLISSNFVLYNNKEKKKKKNRNQESFSCCLMNLTLFYFINVFKSNKRDFSIKFFGFVPRA